MSANIKSIYNIHYRNKIKRSASFVYKNRILSILQFRHTKKNSID